VSISGADIIIQFLEQAGIRIVAGVPGGALLPLYDSLGRSPHIRHILARHEQAAGFIAQGMARVSGSAGVCLATSGPGVTNMVTALADAKLDSVPMICIAGQVPTHLIGTDAFQEVATTELVRPITKACYFVRAASELVEVLGEAFRVAEGGRPGPVLIDVPKNVQLEQLSQRPRRLAVAIHPTVERQDNSNAYAEAARLILAAHRPLWYFGGGVVKARAHARARVLAEQTGIPVTTSLMALGVLPREHSLNLGMLGMHGARYTNHAIDAADLLIAVGTRFDDRATGNAVSFAPKARIIHVDIDAREFGKIKQPTLAIRDDAAIALSELQRHLAGRCTNQTAWESWRSEIRGLREAYPLITPHGDEICSPYGIMRALGQRIPENAIVTTDVGQHQMWAAQTLPIHRADRWLTSGGLGTMGFGLPAAIGAALACPESPVFCITGDGSLLMNIQELATLAELDVDVKVILLDNSALGLVRQQQELFYQRHFVASRFAHRTDFVAVARAFGLRAHDLGCCADDARLLDQVLQMPGPALIRVPIDERHQVLPMVPSGGHNVYPVDHATELVGRVNQPVDDVLESAAP
jgi:acetolactate synthase I/II/III large subunit